MYRFPKWSYGRVSDLLSAARTQVVMLWQKQDGVDVCLYCLYMQEYGDGCPAPNRKWIYLSYLDSVKYFRCSNGSQNRRTWM